MTARAGTGPASDQQFAIWLAQALAPGAPLYNVASLVTIRGPLDPGRLGSALTALVRRHDALHTTFAVRDGVLCNRPAAEVAVVLTCRPYPGDAAWPEVLRAETARPFRLDRDLPLRAVLYRRGPSDHLLHLVTHHIATDAASLDVLAAELPVLYAGGGLPPAGRYADYAAWQRDAEPPRRALEYWTRTLAGATPTALPATRPPDPAERRSTIRRRLPDDLPARAGVAAAAARATPFMLMTAAFAAVLRARTGRDDLLFATNAANRPREADQATVGPYVTVLPVRLRGDPDPGLVRTALLDAYEHQAVPFGRLVAALRARGEWPPAVAALPVLFTMAPAPPPHRPDRTPGWTPAWTWSGAGVDLGTAVTGVSVLVRPERGRWVALGEYDRTSYHRDDIAGLLADWQAAYENLLRRYP
jgi:hypothetical protein